MRLHPFTPNAPIPDIQEDQNLFFADLDASDDQDFFNDHFPEKFNFEPTPETVDYEEIDNEHGIVYYEHAQRLTERSQLQPIPETSLLRKHSSNHLPIPPSTLTQTTNLGLNLMNLQQTKPN